MIASKAAVGRPFVAGPASAARRGVVAAATRRVSETRSIRQQRSQLRIRSAEPAAPEQDAQVENVEPFLVEEEERGPRRFGRESEQPQFKHFLPLPKPAHLIFIKPTVAVVADFASRSSVGLKMAVGDNQLERYVIEFYSKTVK